MNQVVDRLHQEQERAGHGTVFQRLRCFLPGGSAETSYAEAGAALNMAEDAVKVRVHRLRRRCRELLREEVARTVSRPEDVDDELRYLIGLFIA
jgi:RNA polymerase sigma-70 factor (ECF subfamily)